MAPGKNIVYNDCVIPMLLGINSHKVSEMGASERHNKNDSAISWQSEMSSSVNHDNTS